MIRCSRRRRFGLLHHMLLFFQNRESKQELYLCRRKSLPKHFKSFLKRQRFRVGTVLLIARVTSPIFRPFLYSCSTPLAHFLASAGFCCTTAGAFSIFAAFFVPHTMRPVAKLLVVSSDIRRLTLERYLQASKVRHTTH